MLNIFLKLFRPSVALTCLIILGGWQGYSLVRSIPARLPFPFSEQGREEEADAGTAAVEAPAEEAEPPGRVAAAIGRRSAVGRAVLWVAFYTLLCFGCVPLIRKTLEAESNAANAALIFAFSTVGILFAMLLSAFDFGFVGILLLLCAAAYSAGLIFLLAAEVEHMRA